MITCEKRAECTTGPLFEFTKTRVTSESDTPIDISHFYCNPATHGHVFDRGERLTAVGYKRKSESPCQVFLSVINQPVI